MRTCFVMLLTLLISACASDPATKTSSAPAPAAPAAAPAAPAAAPVAKAPQCYNGDDSKFHPVGAQAKVAGVDVVCHAASDGKSAQWMGKKH